MNGVIYMGELYRKSIHLMGTIIDVIVEEEIAEQAENILISSIELIKHYERVFSANRNDSKLMEINLNAGIKETIVDDELYHLIKLGKFHSTREGSFLNITLGPVIQSWRIGFPDEKVPADEEIKTLLTFTDCSNIELDDEKQSVYLKEKGMQINLGALAKGYIADLIVSYLKENDIKSGLINLGGNVLTFGDAPHHNDKNWYIGIQNPILERGKHSLVLNVRNKSVVTSGGYERNLKKEGKTYHHILDPKTGYPIDTDIASITIVSDLSVDGEIWTTRLYGRNAFDIISEINNHPNIEGLVILNDGSLIYSKGINKYIN